MKMKKSILILALTLLAFAIIAAGCSKDKTTGPGDGNSADVSVRLLKSALAERIDLMRLTISQNEAVISQTTTQVVNGAFSFGSIVLPIGEYFFQVEGVDILDNDDQLVIYSGEKSVQIGAGSNGVTVDVTPAVPMVRIAPYNLTTAETATFSSKIEFWNIAELLSGTVTIPFDPTKVRFLSAAAANEDWGNLNISAEAIEGVITLTFSRLTETDIVPGRHDIIDLSFAAVAAGDMTLQPAALSLFDNEGTIPEFGQLYQESQAVHIIGGGSGNRGVLTGYVYNATTGGVLTGANVSITGPDARQTVTDESGSYLFEDLPYGTYEVTAAISGYITLVRTVEHSASVTTSVFALSAQLAAGQYRIVLSWGATPADLDSHLWTTISDLIYEIYFGDQGSATELPFVLLDTDDVDGYGPETITIYQLSSPAIFAVYNYSGDPDITASNAQIEIYSGDQKIGNYSVPTTGTGRWWYVFDLSAQGQITVRNTISDTPPVGTKVSPLKEAKANR